MFDDFLCGSLLDEYVSIFQPMVPPYGAPYAAIYAPGGVYAHPAIPLVRVSLHLIEERKKEHCWFSSTL